VRFFLKHSNLPVNYLIKEFCFVIFNENEIIYYECDLVKTMDNFT